jgi:hypothetical protein
MRQMGIEARNGGAIKAVNCLIVENQFHGVAIGPRGIGYISVHPIEGNGHDRKRLWIEFERWLDPSPLDKTPLPPHLSRMQDSKYSIPPLKAVIPG